MRPHKHISLNENKENEKYIRKVKKQGCHKLIKCFVTFLFNQGFFCPTLIERFCQDPSGYVELLYVCEIDLNLNFYCWRPHNLYKAKQGTI